MEFNPADIIDWKSLIDSMQIIGSNVYGAFNLFLAFFNKPIVDIVTQINELLSPFPIVATVLNAITEFLIGNNELAEMPLWGFLLGGGVIVVCLISLIKWFVGIVT